MAYGIQQFLRAERLRQKLHSARLHCSHTLGDITVSGQKDDGNVNARPGQLRLEVETAKIGEINVENQARRNIRTLGLNELCRRSERLHRKASRGKQVCDGIANEWIVVDHEHNSLRHAHSW